MKNLFKSFVNRVKNYWNRFSHIGLFIGVIFFALSLTPSLLPRTPLFQGLLSGIVLAVGYGIGCFLLWMWRHLEIPEIREDKQKIARIIFGILTGLIIIYALSRSVVWQNSILEVMNQEPVKEYQPIFIAIIAIVTAIIFLGLGRLIRRGFSFLMRKIYKIIPRRIANFIGFIIALLLFIFILNGFLGGFILNVVDNISAKVDSLTDDGAKMPSDPNKTGGSESLISWESLGRPGRNFVSKGPSKEDISSFSGNKALEPIRVYIGLNAAATLKEGAELALAELKRVNAFNRSVLVITTPTGTGWMDPYAADTLEYIHNGDTAIAAMQYSYLQSPIALVVDPDKPRNSSRAMFQEIYNYWTTLPKEERPKLYLNGVSLGSFGSEASFEFYEIINDPFNGALWAGPPFNNELWSKVTENRNAETPMWLPTYKDSSLIRFINNQESTVEKLTTPWGSLRILYLQYASDPISFASPNLLFKKPQWLEGERGHDVSPLLRWYPTITFFQLAFDLMVSVSGAPLGHGHNFSPIHYINSWVLLTDPADWDNEKTNELKKLFSR